MSWREQYGKALIRQAEADAVRIDRGDSVTFTRRFRSRKEAVTVQPGDTAEVFWIGTDRYARRSSAFGSTPLRYGVALADGTRIFVPEDAVERSEARPVDTDALREQASRANVGLRGLDLGGLSIPEVYGPPDPRGVRSVTGGEGRRVHWVGRTITDVEEAA